MTEQVYVMWIERFLRFHRERNRVRWKHPRQIGKTDIEQYVSYLAVEKDVAASAQNQALSAILFRYGKVLEIELPPIWQFEGRCELATVKRLMRRTDQKMFPRNLR